MDKMHVLFVLCAVLQVAGPVVLLRWKAAKGTLPFVAISGFAGVVNLFASSYVLIGTVGAIAGVVLIVYSTLLARR